MEGYLIWSLSQLLDSSSSKDQQDGVHNNQNIHTYIYSNQNFLGSHHAFHSPPPLPGPPHKNDIPPLPTQGYSLL